MKNQHDYISFIDANKAFERCAPSDKRIFQAVRRYKRQYGIN